MGEPQIYQLHLFGPGMSGRGVRFRELTSTELDQAARDAARAISEEATFMELQQLETHEGIKRFIVAVTRRAGLSEKEIMECKDADWEPMTYQKLSMPAAASSGLENPWSYDRLFARPKDHQEMARTYRDYNVLDAKVHEAIRGKVLAVASEDSPPATGTATGTSG
ncbi:MAG TPA: hypothetical protein VFT22_10860 [Kofleriaceae bacterium]|nr:hypothetical protein [Kofleriaceae bacterium]